jgi:hypothetical protein
MGKIRIGVYVFTHQIKERKITDRDRYFEGKAYYGFNYIISEIDTELYEISYVSSASINSVDFALISITSFYDVYNIRKELFGKNVTCKLIFGGSGISNIQSLSDLAYAICIGRGETLINDILEGKPLESVWYKDSTEKIKMGQPKELKKIKDLEEKEVGCRNKCKFCQYGWKFKALSDSSNYNSGYNSREDTITNLDFSLCNRRTAPRLNSAIDGFTEKTRKIIGKVILNEDITNKFKEIYSQEQSYFALKLYAIVGFSWERSIELDEFFEAVERADKESDKKLNVFLISTHFVPMPFTPMECEPINLHNFRDEVIKNKYGYKGKSINVYYPGSQMTSPMTAIEQTIVNRIKVEQLPLFDKLLLSSKYAGLKSADKLKVIDRYFEGIYGSKDQEEICPEIERPFKYKII